MATSDLFGFDETKGRACLAGVRVPSTSNRTSFLMGRSAKEAIAVEIVRTWYESKRSGQTFATWPRPRPELSYAERRFECPPATIISASVYLRRFQCCGPTRILPYSRAAQGPSWPLVHRASHPEPDVDPEENRMGKSQRKVTPLQSPDLSQRFRSPIPRGACLID